MRILSLTVLLIGLLATSASAAPKGEALLCTIRDGKLGNWISNEVVIGFDKDGKTAIVLDAIILYHNKVPLKAKMREKRGKIWLYWYVENTMDTNATHIPQMRYTGIYTPQTRAFEMVAKPRGYPTQFSGRGQCAPIKNRSRWNKLLKKRG
ncbi:MAG: hypothetical protein GYB25_07165 [Rhodobacteraceae bacterium]|nr:hypothetical protein [Paracoccaceae bacterium]